MRIGITGHRPNKLWGYNYDNTRWQELKQLISNILKQYLLKGYTINQKMFDITKCK